MTEEVLEQTLAETKKEREGSILWLFEYALALKIINGALEICAAVLILFVPPSLVLRIADFVTSGELAEDPGDFIATFIRSSAHAFAVHTHYFIALYLALHGAVKVVLVIGILLKKKMAYPLFMLALALFASYELYLAARQANLLLDVFSFLDYSLLILTYYEYRRRYPRAL